MKGLFRAVDNIHPDSTISERQCYKKGDFVVVLGDDHQWGAKEVPPNFVSVSCPAVTVEQARQYLDPWEVRPVYKILASNAQGWRVQITSELAGALKEAAISVSTARTWLENEGCIIRSYDEDGLVVDVPRSADIDEIRERLSQVLGRPHRRKRWCISSAAVDWVLSQGGVDVPVTSTQLVNYLIDKAD